MKFKIFITITLFFILLNYSVWGQSPGKEKAGSEAQKPPVKKIDEAKLAKLSVTHHSITLKGKVFRYQAAAGYMMMKDKSDKHQASIFFIAYTKEDGDMQKRPITFAFNGGPGSAALWLHMGGLGPKRVKMSDEGLLFPQPFQYVENEATWLEFTDLVFIDPVSTGYSRPAQDVDKKQFHGVMEDIRSVGDFIRLYITKNKRWLSPKFICGESYGTIRAVGLAAYLQDTYGMYLQGLVLVSAVLDFHTLMFAPGNDLPYSLFLPTYTASARYHKKLPEKYRENLQTTLKEVQQWALTDYWLALAKGNRLTREERKEIVARLSQYTGLPEKTIENNNLRIEMSRFTLGLLKDEKQIVGRLDSRFKGLHLGDDRTVYNSQLDDPSAGATSGAFTAVVNDYLRNELKYVNDIPYWPLSMEVYPWNFGSILDYIHLPRVLKKAISWNNELKVMIANGYYDLATPYFATLYTVEHIDLPPHLQKNIVMKYYESGHMMYIRKASREKLRDDAYEFYTSSLK